MNERLDEVYALHESRETGNTREVAFSVLLACRETSASLSLYSAYFTLINLIPIFGVSPPHRHVAIVSLKN